MTRHILRALLLSTVAGAALAEPPAVVTDIAPVHSLVSQVMGGLGEPVLLVQEGQSPHEHSLKPSEAGALESAGLIVWVSPELTPWLDRSMESLATNVPTLTLFDAEGTEHLPIRESATFEPHHHGDEDEHDHDEHEGHEDHDEDHDHAHESEDPHAWLAPGNGMAWLDAIAAELGKLDPENAATYAANAEAGKAEIDTVRTAAQDRLAEPGNVHFLVRHDAYHYFEDAFGLAAAGAVTGSDDIDPSPKRLAELQALVTQEGIDCYLTGARSNPKLIAAIFGGDEPQVITVDPLGAGFEMGPRLYTQLIGALADGIAACADQ